MARVPWFRFYSEVLHDPKIQRLPLALRWRWVELLCLANDQEPRGRLPLIGDIAYALRIPEAKASQSVVSLREAGLLEADADDRLWPHNWGGRQFASDARETEGRRKADESRRHDGDKWINPAAKSPPLRGESAVTDTETDTEQSRSRSRAEAETEADASPRALIEFHPLSDPPFPDEPGFVGQYVKAHERLFGKHPGASKVADAADLERRFGTEACVRVATDTSWEKPPSWMIHKLEDRAKQALASVEGAPVIARPKSRRFTG